MSKLIINPPPTDKCCERCGKHINDLLPFSQPELNGAKLVKTFRTMCEEENEELDNINAFLTEIGDTKGWEEAISRAEEKFGKEKTEQAMFYDQLSSTVEASWECKDCIAA